MQSNNKGFTLVELSIVIVIIGLIVAGVTAGQSLVKQAQMRSIITEAQQISAAANAFKLQFDGVPGDITNGSSYWTTGCLAAGGGGASVALECNGDGNKQILVAATNTGEMYMAWYHMSRAGVFPGTFVPGAVLLGVLGDNIPASKFSGAGITLGYDGGLLTSTASVAKNIILFGAPTAANIANKAILTPGQASAIDSKADDNNPNRGAIYGGADAAGAITTCGSAGAAGAYVLATTTATCTLGFAL